MTRTLVALALSLVSTFAIAAPISVAPRDVVTDIYTSRGRPVVKATTNGSSFLLAWEDRLFPAYDTTSSVLVRTYDANGQPEQQLPVMVSAGVAPAAVWNGSEWMVSWRTSISRFDMNPIQRLFAARVNEHASGTGAPVELASTPQGSGGGSGAVMGGSALLIGNYGNTVITSADLQTTTKLAQHVRPLAAAGDTFLAEAGRGVVVMSGDGVIVQSLTTGDSNAAASNGHEYAVVYRELDAVKAIILTPQGSIVKQMTLAANVSATVPDVVYRNGSYLAAWADGGRSLCFASFDDNSAGASQCQSTPGVIESLSLADNGGRTLVAWSETGNASPDHLFTSFSSSSELPQLQRVDAATMLRPQLMPRIEPDTTGVTAVWTDGFSIYAGGLDRGSVVPRPARLLTTGSDRVTSLHLSRSLHSALVLWTAQPPQGNPQVRGYMFPDDPYGASAQGPFTIGEGGTADVASDGAEWLVVWPSANSQPQVMSTIVSAGGIVVSPGGTPLAPSPTLQSSIAVASRGTDFLVAWTEYRPDTAHLFALGVSTEGTPSGGVMDLAGGPITNVRIAASGRFYLIVVSAPNIGFPVTSIVTDILVAGVPEPQVRARARDGGFAVLHGNAPVRATYVDAAGKYFEGGALPIPPYADFDFAYDTNKLVIAYVDLDRVLLDLFAPRAHTVRTVR